MRPALGALGLLWTFGCGPNASHAATAAVSNATPAPAAGLHDCHVAGIGHGVRCGTVRRPLDPARPGGVAIDVHYVVVPALARQKLADPVFLIAGGPGQSAIQLAPALLPLLARLNNRRDLVFVDQRGTGRSAPLACPAPRPDALAAQFDPQRQFERLMACKAALQTRPYGDLRFFTTPLASQDLDAVRRVLGAERIDLVGASYGTRVALDFQRQFPRAVRRSVLDGVAPPDMALPASFSTDGQAALDALFAACDAEPACRRDHPRLRADWAGLVADLPKPVTVADPLTGRPERFTLTRDMLLGAVRGPLYAPALAAGLPAAIAAAVQGRFEGVFGLAAVLAGADDAEPAPGMHFSVVCAEDVPRLGLTHDAAGADFGAADALLYRRVCDAWPRGAVPADFYSMSPAASPVLLLSGGLDPATPPRHAARVAAALGAMALQIVVPNAGHGVFGIGCARDVVFRFIDAQDDAAALHVDVGCLASIPRPAAFQPVDPQAPR